MITFGRSSGSFKRRQAFLLQEQARWLKICCDFILGGKECVTAYHLHQGEFSLSDQAIIPRVFGQAVAPSSGKDLRRMRISLEEIAPIPPETRVRVIMILIGMDRFTVSSRMQKTFLSWCARRGIEIWDGFCIQTSIECNNKVPGYLV